MTPEQMTSKIDSIMESVCQISDLNHDGNLLTASDRDAIDRQVVRITMSAQAVKHAIIGQHPQRLAHQEAA